METTMPQIRNLRAMFMAAAEIAEKARDNEYVEFANVNTELAAMAVQVKCLEIGHKQAVEMAKGNGYLESWQRITPQGKSYDALPE